MKSIIFGELMNLAVYEHPETFKNFLVHKYHETIDHITQFAFVHHMVGVADDGETPQANHFVNIWFDFPSQKYFCFDSEVDVETEDIPFGLLGHAEGIRWLSYFLSLLGMGIEVSLNVVLVTYLLIQYSSLLIYRCKAS